MLDRELADAYVDSMLTCKPTTIVEVDAKEETAIGSCDSAMTLYIFDFEISSKDEEFYSVVIADSENHGIRVFVLVNLHADNLFITEDDNEDEQAGVVASMSGIIFPEGDDLDFQNALRIIEVAQTFTWN